MKKFLYVIMGCLCFVSAKAQKDLNLVNQTEWIHFESAQKISAVQLAQDKSTLKIGSDDNLELLKINDDQLGYRHYRYQQTYKDIPIEGAEYLIHEKANRTKNANGKLIRHINLRTVPRISEADALQAALQYVGAEVYAWEDATHQALFRQVEQDEDATFYPSGELVIIDPEFGQNPDNYRLAYKFDIYAVQPHSHRMIYIDAENRRVLTEAEKLHNCTGTPASGISNYSGTVDFTACETEDTFILKNNINGVEQQLFHAIDTFRIAITDDDGFFEADRAAVDVHYATEKTYEYFWETFGRNSLDDEGRPLISLLHYGNNLNNAGWTGNWMVYGDGDGQNFTSFTAPDIVAHEMIHGITAFSSQLIYLNESGALNESFSDIFGEVIEAYIRGNCDWIAGADFTITPDRNGLRNLRNPNDDNMFTRQPDTYQGEYWYNEAGDNGGVHHNSGVQNYWFYLLAEGGSGINDNGHAYHVEGIGIDKAAAIAYRTLTAHLTSSSKYIDAREGAIQAAVDLYGPDSHEVLQTEAAWCAVGVGDCSQFVTSCRFSDSLALVDFHTAFAPLTSPLWDFSQPIDTWQGVGLNENECVDSLRIKERIATGTLSPSIGYLSELRFLSLPECNLSGIIPSTIGNLTNLTFLSLGENYFTGSIPSELGNLTNLVHLELLYNDLSGCYDYNLKNLCNNLTSSSGSVSAGNNFDASWGSFCSTDAGICFEDIPCPIRDSLVLVDFYNATNGQNWINSWNLSAPIDTWHGVTRNAEGCVTSIVLGNNQLTGTLPASIGYLGELEMLGLGGNQLTGIVPAEIGQLTKLTALGLGANNFGSSIPPEIGNLLNLEQLWLSNSNFIGDIPHQLGQLSNLTHLHLAGNNLTGSIPATFEGLVSLLYWSLNSNQFSGCYPSEISDLCNSLNSDFSDNAHVSDGNNFEATWEDFCNLGNGICPPPTCREVDSLVLVDFYYATNGDNWHSYVRWDLNQPIDTWFGVGLNANQCVDTLFLKEKGLSGTLPESIGDLSEIRFISLPENYIGGIIPSTISNLTNLTVLALGENNFTGAIPSGIGNLTNLTYLGLGNNALWGHIPPGIGDMTNLTNLNLAYNQLNGCYHTNLANLCNTLEPFSMTNLISNGNLFDVSWVDFCNNGEGACLSMWPGDFNNDGIANIIDVLFWGLAAGNTGPARSGANTNWTAQPAPEWLQYINGINGKYQDANGDGTIDSNDLDVLTQNYDLIHGTPTYLNLNSPSYFELRPLGTDQQTGHPVYGIYFSSPQNISISTHGLAFSLDFDELTVNDIQINTDDSALEPTQNFIHSTDNQRVNVALTRTDKNNQIISDGDLVVKAIVIDDDIQTGDPYKISVRGGSAASAEGFINSVNGTAIYGVFSEPGANIPVSISANVRHEQCNTYGHASVEVLSGIPPYTYTWNTGANTAEITHLTADTYTVEVTDAIGQQQSLAVQVDAPSPVYDEAGNEITCDSHISWLTPQLSVILEGAYDTDTGMMNNRLRQNDLLPNIQPYGDTPWNYNGQEGQGWMTTDYPTDAVDWVLVSFRDAENVDRIYAKTAAIVRQDGNLFFPNDRFLSTTTADSMYVVIQHRNHVAVMTPYAVNIDNQEIIYNFTLNDSHTTSISNGQKQLTDGTWVMLAGNCDASDSNGYDINGQDKSLWSDHNGSFGYYLKPDLNLDGEVNGADKVLWSENNGLSSEVPK